MRSLQVRSVVVSCAAAFTLVVGFASAEAEECPPKDTYVCKIQKGADKGKEIVVVQLPQKFAVTNGAFFGSVLKIDQATIDERPLEGSGQVYEMNLTAGHRTYRFVNIDQVDEKTDLSAVLKTERRGTVVVLPQTGQGTYAYDGSPKQLMVCQAKYFAQLNPHTKDGALSDEDICKIMIENNQRSKR